METKPNFIVPLADASAGLSQVGGKGASQVRLAAAGLPVPPGFHITTAAYRRFVAENELQAQILAAVSAALEMDEPLGSHASSVETRKADWQRARKATPPTVLPENHLLAKMFSPKKPQINLLNGKGTSAGQVTAPACVLRGPEDFGQMRPGDVLVAVATTPAWTPLFAMASAVVTNIGGPLGHSSIVACEYGIPAVMATGVATRLIHTGQMITVDGTSGTVTLSAVGGLYPAWRAANQSPVEALRYE